jgi:hypothetical protein
MAQSTQRSGISMAVRSGLWILLAVAFLAQVAFRIHRDHLAGRPITNWVAAQLALWSIVLCFWTFAAFWDWKRRNDARKVI